MLKIVQYNMYEINKNHNWGKLWRKVTSMQLEMQQVVGSFPLEDIKYLIFSYPRTGKETTKLGI